MPSRLVRSQANDESSHLLKSRVSKSCRPASLVRVIKNESQSFIVLRLLLYPVALVNAGMLLPFVWLREMPHFWTNAGGYPIWLRDLVLVAYYPLLTIYVALLALLSWLLVSRPSRSVGLFCVEAAVLGLLWLVVALVAILMLANNITNLIEGRPLHAH